MLSPLKNQISQQMQDRFNKLQAEYNRNLSSQFTRNIEDEEDLKDEIISQTIKTISSRISDKQSEVKKIKEDQKKLHTLNTDIIAVLDHILESEKLFTDFCISTINGLPFGLQSITLKANEEPIILPNVVEQGLQMNADIQTFQMNNGIQMGIQNILNEHIRDEGVLTELRPKINNNRYCFKFFKTDYSNKLLDLQDKILSKIADNEIVLGKGNKLMSGYKNAIKLGMDTDEENYIEPNKPDIDLTCGICYDAQIEYCATPCGHTLCSGCKTRMTSNCFFCSQRVTSTVKLFISGSPLRDTSFVPNSVDALTTPYF